MTLLATFLCIFLPLLFVQYSICLPALCVVYLLLCWIICPEVYVECGGLHLLLGGAAVSIVRRGPSDENVATKLLQPPLGHEPRCVCCY